MCTVYKDGLNTVLHTTLAPPAPALAPLGHSADAGREEGGEAAEGGGGAAEGGGGAAEGGGDAAEGGGGGAGGESGGGGEAAGGHGGAGGYDDRDEHAFFFSYGCIVLWGFGEKGEGRAEACPRLSELSRGRPKY